MADRNVRARKRQRGLSPQQIQNVIIPPRKRYWQYQSEGVWIDYPQGFTDFLNRKTNENGRPENDILVYPRNDSDVEIDLRNYVQWEYDDNDPAGKGKSIRMVIE